MDSLQEHRLRTLEALVADVYHGDWSTLEADLKARLAAKPEIHRLSETIRADLAVISNKNNGTWEIAYAKDVDCR